MGDPLRPQSERIRRREAAMLKNHSIPLRATLILLGSLAAAAFAQNPAKPPAPAATDVQRDLQQLMDQAARLDPKASDYPARVKTILQALIQANQALARENAALKEQLQHAPARATTSTRRPAAARKPAA